MSESNTPDLSRKTTWENKSAADQKAGQEGLVQIGKVGVNGGPRGEGDEKKKQ